MVVACDLVCRCMQSKEFWEYVKCLSDEPSESPAFESSGRKEFPVPLRIFHFSFRDHRFAKTERKSKELITIDEKVHFLSFWFLMIWKAGEDNCCSRFSNWESSRSPMSYSTTMTGANRPNAKVLAVVQKATDFAVWTSDSEAWTFHGLQTKCSPGRSPKIANNPIFQ